MPSVITDETARAVETALASFIPEEAAPRLYLSTSREDYEVGEGEAELVAQPWTVDAYDEDDIPALVRQPVTLSCVFPDRTGAEDFIRQIKGAAAALTPEAFNTTAATLESPLNLLKVFSIDTAPQQIAFDIDGTAIAAVLFTFFARPLIIETTTE